MPEHTSEIGSYPQPIVKTEDTLDSPRKKDIFDRKVFFNKVEYYSAVNAALGLLGAIGGDVLILTSKNVGFSDFVFACGVALVHTLGGGAALSYLRRELNKASKEDITHDSALRYITTRCVYQGKIPLKEKGLALEKGDNFYYLQLTKPLQISEDQPPSEADIGLQIDLYEYIFNNVKQEIVGKDYKAVAIEIGRSMPSFLEKRFEQMPHAIREKLLRGKDVKVQDPDKELLLLTREEFEDLVLSPQEAFVQAVNALGNPRVSHFFDLAKQAVTQEDRDEAKRLLIRSLHQVLATQIEAYFNMPEVIRGRTRDTYAPTKESFHPISYLRRTDSDFYFVQMYDGTGEVRWTPLDKLLQTAQKPIDTILASHSPYQKAQIAYVMDGILRETPFEELVRNRILDRAELIQRLTGKEAEGTSKLTVDVPTGPFGLVIPAGIYKKVRPILTTLLMYGAYKSGLGVVNNFDAIRTSLQLPSSAIVRQYEKPRFPDDLPQPGIDWKIEGTDANGYYVTDTSHQFTEGVWKTNHEVKSKLNLPYALSSDLLPTAINEERFIPLNQITDTTLKIPIKLGTRLGALAILAPDGSKIPHQAFELTDGTVQVDIAQNIINNAPSARIEAFLIPSSTDTVHASDRITPIDTTKLSTLAKAENDIATNPTNPGDNPEKLIRNIVAGTHTYSLNPPGKEALNNAKTPEDIINIVADLPSCDCEVCNSASVLASSIDTKGPAVNLAFGYIAEDNHTTGRGDGFLRSEAAHAFGINDQGEVLDSTPSTIASDQMTQDYVNLLHQTTSENDNTTSNNAWEQQQRKIQEDAQTKKTEADGLKVIGALLAATTGAYVARQASKVLQRVFNRENVSKITDDIMLHFLSENDISKAYNFFGWLSHAKAQESQFPQGKELSNIDKRKALNRIRGNIDQFKLSQYVENPKAFERLAQKHSAVLTPVEARKLRILAQYLIS